jgi:hypothetical protein
VLLPLLKLRQMAFDLGHHSTHEGDLTDTRARYIFDFLDPNGLTPVKHLRAFFNNAKCSVRFIKAGLELGVRIG